MAVVKQFDLRKMLDVFGFNRSETISGAISENIIFKNEIFEKSLDYGRKRMVPRTIKVMDGRTVVEFLVFLLERKLQSRLDLLKTCLNGNKQS